MIAEEERILLETPNDTLSDNELCSKSLMGITNLWLDKGWDDNQLFKYITQRFGRPIERLNLIELKVIKDTLSSLVV